jgi:glutaredoxin-related protein
MRPHKTLDAALRANWALVVSHTRAGHEATLMKQFIHWYMAKSRVIFVDRHPNGERIREEAFRLSNSESLPLLFVNRKFVGDLQRVKQLDEEAKLKDVLQFGFVWGDLHTAAMRQGPLGRVGMLRPHARDEDLFHGKYRGSPITAPVASLPQFSAHSRRE